MSRYKEFCPSCSFGGCEKAEKFVADPSAEALRCPHFKGRWMYRQLPSGMKNASIQDFIEHDRIRIGLRYLLQSFYTGRFEAYTVSDLTNIGELQVFIREGKCFIKQ